MFAALGNLPHSKRLFFLQFFLRERRVIKSDSFPYLNDEIGKNQLTVRAFEAGIDDSIDKHKTKSRNREQEFVAESEVNDGNKLLVDGVSVIDVSFGDGIVFPTTTMIRLSCLSFISFFSFASRVVSLLQECLLMLFEG